MTIGLPQLERACRIFELALWALPTVLGRMAPLKNVKDRYGYPKYPIRQEGRCHS